MDISCAGGRGWTLPLWGAAPRCQRPPRRWGKQLRGETPPPPLLVSEKKIRRRLWVLTFYGLNTGNMHWRGDASYIFSQSLHVNSTRWTHHKLLSQFVAHKVQALWMLWGGDRLSPGHHRSSRQQLVDLVEDFSELRSTVAGDLADGDCGCFLELQLQLLCLSPEKKYEIVRTRFLLTGEYLDYKYSRREAQAHLGVFWGVQLFEWLRAPSSRLLQLLVPLQHAVFGAVLQPCWKAIIANLFWSTHGALYYEIVTNKLKMHCVPVTMQVSFLMFTFSSFCHVRV